jgi:hypothetical protein
MMLSTGAKARRRLSRPASTIVAEAGNSEPISDGIVRFALSVYEVVALGRLAFTLTRQPKIRRAVLDPKT